MLEIDFEIVCNQTVDLFFPFVDVVLAKVFDYASTALTFGDVGCAVGTFFTVFYCVYLAVDETRVFAVDKTNNVNKFGKHCVDVRTYVGEYVGLSPNMCKP